MKLFYLCQIFREFTVFKIINGQIIKQGPIQQSDRNGAGLDCFKPSVFSSPFLHPVIHNLLYLNVFNCWCVQQDSTTHDIHTF